MHCHCKHTCDSDPAVSGSLETPASGQVSDIFTWLDVMILETLFVHQCACQGMCLNKVKVIRTSFVQGFYKIMLMTFSKWRKALRKTSKILLMKLP